MRITTTQQLKEEIATRAKLAGLDVQCSSDGAFHAEVVIVSEAPGEVEVSKKRPMSGGGGMKLWETLRRHGFDRTQVYTTNVCKRQVSFGDDKRHPINKHETQLWTDLLHWELSQLPNAKYILVLGNLALNAIAGKSGITHWRGSVLDTTIHDGLTTKQFQSVCAYNPAMVLRDPKLELSFAFDCGKLRKVADGKWVHIPCNVLINPSYHDATDYLDKLARDGKPTGYDIEVIANETACIGFANSGVEAMSINFRTQDGHQFTSEEERKLRRRMQAFFVDENVPLIAQNNMFDSSWLLFKDRIRVKPIWLDTMLAHHCLYPQLPHNLGFITTQYTSRPYYKDEKDEWKLTGNINDFWTYNGQDCCNTVDAAISMASELKAQSLDTFFFEHIMHAQPHLLRMVVGGVKMDMGLRAKFTTDVEAEVSRLLDLFYDAVKEATGDEHYEPNPKSPKQMTELYFSRLKLVGRGVSTNAENRARMFSHPATTEPKRKVLRAVDEYSKEHKFFSTYVTSGVDDDERMRCNYNQTGVISAPGRLSSSGMLWKNAEGIQTGMNLQNQPERAHGLYIADEGYGLGYFDLSQAEARVVGWYARIEKWIEQFEKARIDGKYDAHRALASEMFGIEYDKVPTYDRYDSTKGHVIPVGAKHGDVTVRYIAKRCRHGLNYRMGPDRLATVTGLSMSDATSAYRKYHGITPELQRWWSSLEEEVRKTKTLFNAYGRRFILLERLSPEALESIVAFKPQSTVGDKVVKVIYQCHEDPRWPLHARMLLNIHDALICLAPKHKLQLCLSIAKKYAEEPIMINGMPLIIPADTKISYENERGFHSWGSLKSIEIEAAK